MSVTFISIASVALALVTAGCIAYVAWDLTSEDKQTDDEQSDGSDTGEPPDNQ